MMRAVVISVLTLLAFAASAQDADRPTRLLAAAETALAAAKTPKERLAALGLAAQAQEAVLLALRGDMRDLSMRTNGVAAAMAARERTLRAVLSALERLERIPHTAVLAHPGGALSAARAGMALSAFTPALEGEAARLRRTLDEIGGLSARRQAAAVQARGSLASLQAMRTEIAALLDRERKTRRLPEDIITRLNAETAALADSADSFRALAAGLPTPPDNVALKAAPSIRAVKGDLTPPAEGALTRPFGEGREGASLSVPAYAEIYAPWPGVIRFAGPFGDHGGVVILEPEPGMLMVFGGLGEILAEPGDLVLQGQPLGAMGGPAPEADEFLIASGEGSAALGRETLYMEIRENGAPVDPATWFAFVMEGG